MSKLFKVTLMFSVDDDSELETAEDIKRFIEEDCACMLEGNEEIYNVEVEKK